MSSLIVAIDDVVVKEVQLTKARLTLGRRPYNDVVLDQLAVSGEHAAILMKGGRFLVEDLGSTNGTLVNGRAVSRQVLEHGDVIEVGHYTIRYVENRHQSSRSHPVPISGFGSDSDYGEDSDFPVDASEVVEAAPRLRVVSGSSAGRQIRLTKPVTTLGKRGFAVAAITRGSHGFELSHVEGRHAPTVNGVSVEDGPIVLQNHDQIRIGLVRLEYSDR